ncbi:hypothetical protein DUI87_27146 [Hirundo rustica rustica]|uniref:dUTPase-like domain-containing protein n=1 Tax=Hirundo rustica rustica TaxID=333673 RepID=A0A3M0J4Z8_HIRRU|nr:hypothetical protein DUI87_27146 [Hirundo rustica rustica]
MPTPPSPTPPDPPATEPFPGALSDLAEAMAQGRRETWAALAQQGWQREDPELAAAAQEQIDTCAFPVIFQPNPQGGQRAELVNLDWKLLSQLRATVASYGVTSEPAKQMLEFLFNANLLLPSDIRGISKLIYTPHQRLLFEARWREEAAMSAALPRPQGDPLTGLTMNELMGQGPFHRIEAQVALGQEKLREAMAVARRAMGKIRAPGGTPIYMGIKQGRDEPLGSFVDKIIEALSKAGGQRAELVNLDWKLLSQLRATVASYGVTSEPAKQMLEFLFNANLLLPSDIRGISKLIYTPHQRLLFEARWREEAAVSAALPRPQGDPLTGLTMNELMGQGPFHRIEAQRRLCPVRIGKLQNQREVGPRQDTSSSSCSADNQLVPATSGSLGLDLAAAVTVTLFNNSPHVVSTGVFGPIIVNGQPTGGLILGRSSGSVLGLFIEPGVVDADSEGEIFVIASTPYPPMKILKGQKIAQFVPLPQLTANILPRSKEPRGTGCLGSSGAITLPVIDLKFNCKPHGNIWDGPSRKNKCAHKNLPFRLNRLPYMKRSNC